MDLPESDKRRAAAVLGMLASDFAGERATAALKLTELLARHKMRPEDLLNGKSNDHDHSDMLGRAMAENIRLHGALAAAGDQMRSLTADRAQLHREIKQLRAQLQAKPQATPPPPRSATYRDTREEISALLDSGVRWSNWEREFLESMSGWRGAPTARQEQTLDKVRERLRQHEAARKATSSLWD
jgi:hypothetical protein